MDEPYDVGSGFAPGMTAQRPEARVDPQTRTPAFLGPGLALVALGAMALVVAREV